MFQGVGFQTTLSACKETNPGTVIPLLWVPRDVVFQDVGLDPSRLVPRACTSPPTNGGLSNPPPSIFFCCFDSASLPFKFLMRLPGGCSGGEGTPQETLKCLKPNPYS